MRYSSVLARMMFLCLSTQTKVPIKMRPSEVEMRSDWFNKALTASTRGRCATELMFCSVDAGDGEGGSGTWAGGGTDDEAIG